jgi:hypothetical protein
MAQRLSDATLRVVTTKSKGEEFVSLMEQRNMSIFAASRDVSTRSSGGEFV